MLYAADARAATYVLNIGAVQGAEMGYIHSLREFSAAIEQASGGQFDVKLRLSGREGDELELVRKTIKGDLRGAFISAATLSTPVPAFRVLTLPKLFNSTQQARNFIGSRLDRNLRVRALKKRFQVLGYGSAGFYGVLARPNAAGEPVEGWPQMERAITRTVRDKWRQKVLDAMLLRPAFVPPEGMDEALSSGWLNAIEASPESLSHAGLATENTRYFPTNHLYGWMVLVVNNHWYRSLPSELRTLLHSRAERILTVGITQTAAQESNLLEQWRGGSGPVLLNPPEADLLKRFQPLVWRAAKDLEWRLRTRDGVRKLWLGNNGFDPNQADDPQLADVM
ncbi:putative TRAP dicarboxylate transporter-DctP subunit [Magnetofaba australis IT-1]|uniref:Putative TRAP dicarboxylate transporter-DctP subunit n=2 Tax=Magnetofaba TaxID=1472292 RepID=A0A1Y2K245_9PROT|nr:putative TRAP dicarboxylate transporter-DctP subunit [Magnetofaba australis IT-1]